MDNATDYMASFLKATTLNAHSVGFDNVAPHYGLVKGNTAHPEQPALSRVLGL